MLHDLASDGAEPDSCTVRLEADVRFERQGAELGIPIACDGDGHPLVDGLHDEFRAEYVQRFGAGAVAMGVAIEVMTLRAIGSAPEGSGTERAWVPSAAQATIEAAVHAAGAHRAVHLSREGAAVAVPAVAATALAVGMPIDGPALVDAGDTTVWIAPGRVARLDERGSLVVEDHEEAR